MRPWIVGTLCCLLLAAASAWAQEPEELPAVEPPAIGWLPSLADLEAAGATIGEIRIRPQNIFDLTDSREDNLLYRLANVIHVVTRPEVVRETLLFKTGERLSLRVIEESERLLRSTLQVYSVRIRVVAVHDGVVNRTVDLEVVTRDRWTLDPSVSFGRTGGANTDRVGLKETNLFGTGLSVGFSRSSNVDRTSNTFDVSHPHAFGPFTNASYSYADTSDGRSWAASITKPFFALDSRYSGGASASNNEITKASYVSSMNSDPYRHQQCDADLF